MLAWISFISIILTLFFVELGIYICYLLIKALRIYIRKNSENISSETLQGKFRKPWVKAIIIAVLNIIVIVSLLAMPTIIKNHNIYVTDNVINIQERDIDKATELFQDNKIDYKLVSKTGFKVMDDQDFSKAVQIAQDNGISYSVSQFVNH